MRSRSLFASPAPAAPQRPAAAATQINVVGVIDLLERAKKNGLKFPKLRLQLADGSALHVKIAGDASRTPGYVLLTDAGRYPDNRYFGRISPAGTFEVGRDGHAILNDLVQLLVRLSYDPAKVAAEYGHLTGNCCFCHLPLKDERSTRVGYGPICAQKFALPWAHMEPTEE